MSKKIIEWALSQVGVKETGTNINPYAADIDKNYPDFYNTKKQGAEWGDIFVDYGFIKNYGMTEALRLTCQPKKSCGAGCKFSFGYYKKKKQVGKDAKVGAQIFFSTNGTEDGISHTGIVVAIEGGKVITVEGNKGNQVSKCSYSKTDKRIFGYGYPDYKEETKTVEPVKKVDTFTTYTVKAGDTLTKIAKVNETTVARLMKLNPDIKDKNKIFVGQVIKLVEAPAPVEKLIGYRVIITASGLNVRKVPTTIGNTPLKVYLRGTEVKVKKVAPIGDPIDIELRDYELCISKSDLSQIEEEVIK